MTVLNLLASRFSPRLSFVVIGLHKGQELRHVGCESPSKLNRAQMLSRQSVACRSQRQTTLAKTVRLRLEYNQEASLSIIETEISTVATESSVHVCQCEFITAWTMSLVYYG